jgi:hypothetical protein
MCEYTVASPYLGRWACGAILSIPRLTLESRRWQAAFSSRYQVTVEKQERLFVVRDLPGDFSGVQGCGQMGIQCSLPIIMRQQYFCQ